MQRVVEGARQQGSPQPWFSVCSSSVLSSFSPTLLLSQLVVEGAIDIITVLATKGAKGVDRCVPTLVN